MSFAEMKEKVPALPREERLDLAHLLRHLELQDDPEYGAEMDRRMTEMDAGKKFTLEDLDRLSNERLAQAK